MVVSEDLLLDLIRAELPVHDSSVLLGSGDDCALVEWKAEHHALVLKTDATIEGIHFNTQAHLTEVGWKAFCRPISDFAAMGATPKHALITVAAPSSLQKEEWIQLARGFGKAARAFNIIVVGGEVARAPETMFISVSISGYPGKRSTLRSQAHEGDLICVTGKLGGALQSGCHLRFMPRLSEGQWLAAQEGVHAMMDLSDGLGTDLPRLARASHCSFQLELDHLPCHQGCSMKEAISDGEDYELLLTIAPQAWPKLQKAWNRKFPTLLLTSFGKIGPPHDPSTLLTQGYEHFILS